MLNILSLVHASPRKSKRKQQQSTSFNGVYSHNMQNVKNIILNLKKVGINPLCQQNDEKEK